MRTRNFFFLLDNYLLQLHVAGNTDSTDGVIFNNVSETDLNRRFNAVVFSYMSGVNGTMEALLVQSPLALIFTENESRMREVRAHSYRRALHRIMTKVTNNQNALYTSSFSSPDETSWSMLFHNRADAAYDGMSATAIDSPPSGTSLLQLLAT